VKASIIVRFVSVARARRPASTDREGPGHARPLC